MSKVADELEAHPDYPFKWYKGRVAEGTGDIYYDANGANDRHRLRYFKPGRPAYFTQIGHKVILVAGELSTQAIRMASFQLALSLIDGPFTKPVGSTQVELNSLVLQHGVKV